MVQVRERDLPDDALRDLVKRILERAPPDTRVVVNGRYRVARTARVGLHLPAGALPPTKPRSLALYGRSAHDDEEARAALAEGVSYMILGTIYPTASKPGHPGSGVDLVREVSQAVQPTPVYAIGGIEIARVPEVIHAGAHGVAVCGAILSASDPRRVAEAFTLALHVTAGEAARPAPDTSARRD